MPSSGLPQHYSNDSNSKIKDLKVRRIPYPYQAMLAICSDLDDTPDENAYFEIIKYLNSTEMTSMGRGLGLETGNSIYFDMPSGYFSYWNADEKGRHTIRSLIQSGHIDCLHSYGDLAILRAHAERALEELNKYGCKLNVWVDHGTAPSNFGSDIMKGQGDLRSSKVYHADITTAFGIKYVWLGRVTSITGQETKRSFKGILNINHPVNSAVTILKELSKVVLAMAGEKKYSMHRLNNIMEERTLRSGQTVFEFIRSNPHWGGVSCGDGPDGLPEIINDRFLASLIEREGICILYTHLGKCDGKRIFSEGTKGVFSSLSRYFSDRKILVTTTERLLNYCSTIRNVNLTKKICDNRNHIYISSDSNNKMDGLSLYVDCPDRTDVFLNNRRMDHLCRNEADHTGIPSISFPWTRLEYPNGLL